MKQKLLLLLLLLAAGWCTAQVRSVRGHVTSASEGQPLPGVNVIIKGSTQGTATDKDGNFIIELNGSQTLILSYIGFTQLEVQPDESSVMEIQLVEDIATLKEITIVSTGYQELPKERANGSFVQIGNTLLNRRVGTSLLARLEDVTSGLIFNRNVSGRSNDISIRGMSTITSQAKPLIVIDNFPYEGDINTINPNDVESITVLKDAASASIWGARAGNGVIVITTKKGSYGQPMKVTLNSNLTITERPDLFYNPLMSSSEVIENERRLFDKGFYSALETAHSAPLTPAVELMIAQRDGAITPVQYQAQIAALGEHDVRSDYEKYLYRNSINQQYAINLNGGSSTNRYYASLGWDKNRDNLVANQYQRVTINLSNTWMAWKDRLTVSGGIYFSQNTTQLGNEGHAALLYNSTYSMYQYARLKDDNGNNLSVVKDYRTSFIQQAQQDGLLNWDYVPLDELTRNKNTLKLNDYRLNGTLSYKIIQGLNAQILYQYWYANSQRSWLRNENSYYARNLVNQYSSVQPSGLVRPVPVGAILDQSNSATENHAVRTQLNYSRELGLHSINALAGYEVRQLNTLANTSRNYGYNTSIATVQPVNYITPFERYDNPNITATIPFVNRQSSLTDRYVSYYINGTYAFKNRYSISGSARTDKSNLFGVNANQRAVPLWSAGIGWTISEESFFQVEAIPFLKIRSTYGVNGNINKSTTAYATALSVGNDFFTNLSYSMILNPANPDLKWEKVGIFNTGIDFQWRDNRLSGSIEYFRKQGNDLIGATSFAPSAGVTLFSGNFAATRSHGMDVTINTLNIDREFKWNTTLLLSTIQEKVSSYKGDLFFYDLLTNGSGENGLIAPLEGKPLYSLYSYPWAGLNPETGAPQSLLNAQVSTDYAAIENTSSPQSLIYNGPARPTWFGSLRNTLSWHNVSLSFNITYRLGYYFRKASVNYDQVLNGLSSHADYSKRWQQPGDEQVTSVPSMPDAYDFSRSSIYQYSELLVEKADHVRLQDVRLSYTISNQQFPRLPFRSIELYSYANNLGIIWKAASGNIDPDYPTLKPSRSLAFGLRADF